ncbi:MAG: fasciclin domain-containing protein [Alteraurantiacibacter sp.]
MKTKRTLAALAATGLLALSACNSEAEMKDNGEEEVSSETLAALLEGSENLSVISEIFANAGLHGVFDGNAPYTVFAPTDEAFAALDIPLDGPDARAARVAIVREHIVPGYLSMDDIAAAIASADGSAEMQTMGSNTLTFSQDGDNLVVTSSDGTSGVVAGDVISGANGSVIPMDTVLKSMEEPQ